MHDQASAERELWEGLMLVTSGEGPEADRGPDTMWRLLLKLAELARRSQQLPEARAFAVHALRHAERVDSPVGRAQVHSILADLQESLGLAQHATEHRRQAVEELRRIGDRRTTAELLIALADPRGASVVDARQWLKEADALASQIGWQEGVTRSRAALAQLSP
jgi:hypothetical protein